VFAAQAAQGLRVSRFTVDLSGGRPPHSKTRLTCASPGHQLRPVKCVCVCVSPHRCSAASVCPASVARQATLFADGLPARDHRSVVARFWSVLEGQNMVIRVVIRVVIRMVIRMVILLYGGFGRTPVCREFGFIDDPKTGQKSYTLGALPYLHCGGEKGKPCTYFETLCLCHMSSARSTSDGRGPVTRKRVPDREEQGKPRKDARRGRCHPLE